MIDHETFLRPNVEMNGIFLQCVELCISKSVYIIAALVATKKKMAAKSTPQIIPTHKVLK